MSVDVFVKKLPHALDLPLPEYGSADAAGCDLLAAIDGDISLYPGGRELVPTGLGVALPQNYELQIRPRSGLALKYGLTVLNAPGTIDADYRGEIAVILINLGEAPFVITRGMRIAQMVIAPVRTIVWQLTETLPITIRGQKGFGSTGEK